MPHLKGKRPSRVGRSNSYLLSFYSYFFLSQGFCKYLYARHLLVTGLWKGAVPSPHCGEFMCTMGACHINNMQLQVCTNARESQQQEGWLTHCAHPGRFSKTHWAIFFYLLVYLFYIIERNVCIWSSLKLSPKHIILLIEGPCHYSRKHTRDWNRPHPSHLVKGIDPSIGLFLCFPINLSLSRSPFPGSPKHAVKWTILRRNSLLIPISIFISPLLFPDELSKELNLLTVSTLSSILSWTHSIRPLPLPMKQILLRSWYTISRDEKFCQIQRSILSPHPHLWFIPFLKHFLHLAARTGVYEFSSSLERTVLHSSLGGPPSPLLALAFGMLPRVGPLLYSHSFSWGFQSRPMALKSIVLKWQLRFQITYLYFFCFLLLVLQYAFQIHHI